MLSNFYQSDEWIALRLGVINERLNDEGFVICEYCGKPIVRAYDIIAHHKEELTEENVNDANISLNPENIMLVHHRCHNYIHNKLGYSSKKIYLVYGAPLSGKTSYVKSVREPGDLIIDMDNIWQCVSDCDRYIKPARLNAVVFKVRDTMLDAVRYRLGKWNNAYIIGGYPLISERERLIREFGAEAIYIECSMDECMRRLNECSDNRDKTEWAKYISNWFHRYTPPILP